MTTCNKPVSHRTDQGLKVCAEHASVIKADPADDAPLVHGLEADAKRGELCGYFAPYLVEEPELEVEAVEDEGTTITETVESDGSEPLGLESEPTPQGRGRARPQT